MSDLRDFSVKVQNYKCFGEEPQGFDKILPFNIIVGRNNAGKSTLLDLLKLPFENSVDFSETISHNEKQPTFTIRGPLGRTVIDKIKPFLSQNGFDEYELSRIDMNLIGKEVFIRKTANDISLAKIKILESDEAKLFNRLNRPNKINFYNVLAKHFDDSLPKYYYMGIHAERDLLPEEDESLENKLNGKGTGATNIIQHIQNKSKFNRDILRINFLDELNKIVEPDIKFEEIIVRQNPIEWEIFLIEKDKYPVALSDSGSGLKTIILVLIFLLLEPAISNRNTSKDILAFEELENNIHPALLRRLLNYLVQKQNETDCTFFLTTHSSVTIDFFSKNEDAQIIHVTHDGKEAKCKTVQTYSEKNGILDDLDVRASDLLQSNGIIWVEGPSDKIYLNKWIDLYSEGALKEGVHYQCVFYGGKLLSHYDAKEPAFDSDTIPIFNINRHAAILMDSDIKDEEEDIEILPNINKSKQRVFEEFSKFPESGMAWVTNCREIENYIPVSVLKKRYGEINFEPIKKFQNFYDYLDEYVKDEGSNYKEKKVQFAEEIVDKFSRESLDESFDLKEKLEELCNKIRKWNHMD